MLQLSLPVTDASWSPVQFQKKFPQLVCAVEVYYFIFIIMIQKAMPHLRGIVKSFCKSWLEPVVFSYQIEMRPIVASSKVSQRSINDSYAYWCSLSLGLRSAGLATGVCRSSCCLPLFSGFTWPFLEHQLNQPTQCVWPNPTNLSFFFGEKSHFYFAPEQNYPAILDMKAKQTKNHLAEDLASQSHMNHLVEILA